MAPKRRLSSGEASAAKRQSEVASKSGQSTDSLKTAKQYVYLAVEEMYGPYMETIQEIFEVYANGRRRQPKTFKSAR